MAGPPATEWDFNMLHAAVNRLRELVELVEKERGAMIAEQPPRPTGWAIIRDCRDPAAFLALGERGPYLDGFEVFCGERGFVLYEKERPLADIGNMPSGHPTWFPFDDDDPATVIRLLGLNGAKVALLYRDTLEEVELR